MTAKPTLEANMAAGRPPRNFETIAWNAMRYSGALLIVLAFGHVILQDVVVGVHAIDLDYVEARWASLGWRIYDGLLLAFAFAHGMNGVRQVAEDYIHGAAGRRAVRIGLLFVWAAVSAVGAASILGGVRPIQ